ncbi:MAG: CHAD domain-containing protein [Gemmataceae bacterium]
MNNPKWIAKLTATTPLRKAATLALTNRFQTVLDYLPLAVEHPEEDIEHVHQLRVGTRRAEAAVNLFACCLASKNRKTISRELRRIRRTAGAARDWDVFLEQLKTPTEEAGADMSGIDFLRGYAMSERLRAQARLVRSTPRPSDLHKSLEKTVSSVGNSKKKGTRLIDLAEPRLSQALDTLAKATTTDLADDKNVHRVRLAGKRLRYAMDLFAHCFDAEFREKHYAAVEEMQKLLGNANDSFNANEVLSSIQSQAPVFLGGLWSRYRATWEKLQQEHKQRWDEGRRQLQEWLVRWLQPSGEPALRRMLATVPKRGQLLILQ